VPRKLVHKFAETKLKVAREAVVDLRIVGAAMSDVVVRKATIRDAVDVAALSGVLGYPVDRENMKRRLEQLDGREDQVVFVAELNGEIVGWIEGAEHDALVADRMGEICGLVVADGRRTSGVGRRLVAAVEQWASARGLEYVSVRSNIVRTESHPFYEKVGYIRLKTQHVYRKTLKVHR
jgi:GNAT superfamily N-acetyltransferase